MKQYKGLLWMVVILPVIILNSCEKFFNVEQEGILKLSVTLEQQGELKTALNDSSVFSNQYLIITVVNENGEIVMNDERIELYNFGGQWITKEIRLKVGFYELTRFLVVDPQGNVLFAAPIEDSPKAYLSD